MAEACVAITDEADRQPAVAVAAVQVARRCRRRACATGRSATMPPSVANRTSQSSALMTRYRQRP